MHRPWLPLRPRRDAAAAAVQHDAHTLRTPKHRSCCCCSTQRAWSRGTEQYLYCTWYSTEQYRTRTVQYRHRVCPGSTRCLFTGTGTAVPIQRHRGYRVPVPVQYCYRTGKKTPGDRGSRYTRGTHGRTQAHGSRRRTSQPSKPTNTPARPRDDRSIRGRLNSRSPGASPR